MSNGHADMTDAVADDIIPRPCGFGFTDHMFESASGTELAVRVWPAKVSAPAPFLLWTHGGGFIGGCHYTPRPWLDPGFRQRGYHLVSHNYRLAPQASIEQQLADCLESLDWCRRNLPRLLGADKVDVDRYVLCGESAGGHLVTLMALHLPNPQPRAVIDIYGVTDFVAMKDLDKEETPKEWNGEFTPQELEAFLDDRDSANILTDALCWTEMELFTEAQLSRYWGSDIKYDKRIRLQSELHNWRSQHPKGLALLIRALLHPERFDSEDRLGQAIRSVSPLHVLRERQQHGTASYPPTAFLHGTGDVDVPVRQSRDMAQTLRELGIPTIERYEEDQPHVFEQKYTVCEHLSSFDACIITARMF